MTSAIVVDKGKIIRICGRFYKRHAASALQVKTLPSLILGPGRTPNPGGHTNAPGLRASLLEKSGFGNAAVKRPDSRITIAGCGKGRDSEEAATCSRDFLSFCLR